jgi:hypothetical protein
MQTKFYGGIQTPRDRNTLRTAARYAMGERVADFHFYMTNGIDSNAKNLHPEDSDEYNAFESFYENNGGLHDYYFSVKYVTPDESDNREGHLHVNLSNDDKECLRLYFAPESAQARKIEFVYWDGRYGVSLVVTTEGWAQWFADELVRVGVVQSEMDKVMEFAG